MNIGMFFYLVDLAVRSQVIIFIILLVLAFFICASGYLYLANSSEEGDKQAVGESCKVLKRTGFSAVLLVIVLVLIPSKTTLYVMGGEKAVYSIMENQDNKEIINLIKQITIQKLQEIAKEGK